MGIQYPPGIPPAPVCLGEIGRDEYERVAALLATSGQLTQADHGPLFTYAQAFEEIADHTTALALEGYVLTGDRGAVLNPRSRALTAARQSLLASAATLGLTPAARVRLPAAQPRGGDDGGDAGGGAVGSSGGAGPGFAAPKPKPGPRGFVATHGAGCA